MRIVIDASVALKWVLSEPDSDIAIALRHEELIAPTLWLAEAANALWRAVRVGQLTAAEADDRFAELKNAPMAPFEMDPYLSRALRLAIELNHPIYDCIYLALAVHHETYVVTADRRFAAISDRPGMSGRVHLLSG